MQGPRAHHPAARRDLHVHVGVGECLDAFGVTVAAGLASDRAAQLLRAELSEPAQRLA